MVKSFLILIFFQIFLGASQLIVVVAKDLTSQKAKAYCFEDGKIIFSNIDVNLGKNGLAFDEQNGFFTNTLNYVTKKEGDRKSPIGVYKIGTAFGYTSGAKTLLKYEKTPYNLICVDDAESSFYNQIIPIPPSTLKSFELMRRDDIQYKLLITLSHNQNATKGAGSCIFLHIEKDKNTPTAGCTSMSENDLKRVLKWLNKHKNPKLLQVDKNYLPQAIKLYPELKNIL